MLDQEFRRPEALLVFEMVGNHRLAGMQGKTGRRGEIGAHAGRPDNAFIPPDSSAHQQAVLGLHIFQNLAIFGLQAFRRQACSMVKQIDEGRPLKRQNAKVRQDLLLANAQPKRALGQADAFADAIAIVGRGLYDRLVLGRGWIHHMACKNVWLTKSAGLRERQIALLNSP